MKKLILLLLAAGILCFITACSEGTPPVQGETDAPPAAVSSSSAVESSEVSVPQEDNVDGDVPQAAESDEAADAKDAPPPADPPATDTDEEISADKKVLIAYFTWADNTVVEDPSGIDVDATASASVLVPGNTAKLAAWLQQETGGDLFQILVEEPYSSDYDECLDRAAEEKAQNARPALTRHLDNMEEYDVVFLGYPNWWYSCPMALLTFLEGYDFSGKTVIPFCAHGTGGLASSVQDIAAAIPEATLLEAFGVYRPDVDGCREDLISWARGLGVAY